jgi:hypothetical protein
LRGNQCTGRKTSRLRYCQTLSRSFIWYTSSCGGIEPSTLAVIGTAIIHVQEDWLQRRMSGPDGGELSFRRVTDSRGDRLCLKLSFLSKTFAPTPPAHRPLDYINSKWCTIACVVGGARLTTLRYSPLISRGSVPILHLQLYVHHNDSLVCTRGSYCSWP